MPDFLKIHPIVKRLVQNLIDAESYWELSSYDTMINKQHSLKIEVYRSSLDLYSIEVKENQFSKDTLNTISKIYLKRHYLQIFNKLANEKRDHYLNSVISNIPTLEDNSELFI